MEIICQRSLELFVYAKEEAFEYMREKRETNELGD